MNDPQSGHSVQWALDHGTVTGAITCHEPVGAPCRTTCAALCDEWPCDHPRKNTDYCVVTEWIESLGIEESHVGGRVLLTNGPIKTRPWALGGDGYAWHYPQPTEAGTP